MDFGKLIDFYNNSQKNLFTAFIINLPIVYSFLYLFTDSFQNIDIIRQTIFAITADIISMFCIFLMSLYRTMKLNGPKWRANVIVYILPQCLTGLIYFPLLPIVPKWDLSIYIPISFFLSIIILVCIITHRTAKNLKNNVKSETVKRDKV